MAAYDIYTDDINTQGYIIHGNNEAEAIGRARERWNIPDDQPLYAFLRAEAEKTQEVISLADYIHNAGQRVYVAWQTAYKAGDHMTASRLESVFKAINRSYLALATYAELIDADQLRDRASAGRTFKTGRKAG